MQPFYPFRLGLSPFADSLSERILHRFKNQGWEGLVDRVVALSRKSESSRDDVDSGQFLENLREAMLAGRMLPNSPLLVNCAERNPSLFACFAIDVEKPVQEFLPTFRMIHDSMGGVGYAVNGCEPSLTEFIRLIDSDTVAHQVGRPRPASNAVTMPIGGDLDSFLSLAGQLKTTNMNVALDDEFMRSVLHEDSAQARLRSIAHSIHSKGQPGIIFPDRITQVARQNESKFAANVCGEAPLAVDESALLASINVSAFCQPAAEGRVDFDEKGFCELVRLCVRFLDGMHDLQSHATEEIRANTLATRKVGVGIMGFSHALILLGYRYGSEESIVFARRLSGLLYQSASEESMRLAERFGAYPAYLPEHGTLKRNANLAAIAGTATIALIVGTSCGIEPIFSHLWTQKVIDREIQFLDPVVKHVLTLHGINPENVRQRLLQGEALASIAGEELAYLMPIAVEVSGIDHILVQSALQSHIDCGITKTINCGSDTLVEEIQEWIVRAHDLGCVGLTIYRDQSLADQPIRNNVKNDTVCNI